MCRPASFRVTEQKVLWHPFSESHTDIAAYHNLDTEGDTDIHGNYSSVPVEVLPPLDAAGNANFCAPLRTWRFELDSDVETDRLPEWWDSAEVEARVRKTLEEEWALNKLVTGNRSRVEAWEQVIVARTGRVYTLAGRALVVQGEIGEGRTGCRIALLNGGTIEFLDGVVERMQGDALIKALGQHGAVDDMRGGEIGMCQGIARVHSFHVTVRDILQGGIVTVSACAVPGPNIVKMSGGTLDLRNCTFLAAPVKVQCSTYGPSRACIIAAGAATGTPDIEGWRWFDFGRRQFMTEADMLKLAKGEDNAKTTESGTISAEAQALPQ